MTENGLDAEKPRSDYIRDLLLADAASGRFHSRVQTRFPPEPNGFLHIGHAKAICLDFAVAAENQGSCNLRFDDTNPSTEDHSYVDAIIEDLAWLGFVPDAIHHSSDYFDQLCTWAELLISKGLAYVDDQNAEDIAEQRGGFGRPGTESPFRGRSTEENLDLFQRMRQ
ncbi:MAG TPA: glutamate--tRNA ligase family protein, partial [Acidimicrobiales bacterium]|nr:glutamate--tRNA ligase family protein [Acidimicrobiales bacterium]